MFVACGLCAHWVQTAHPLSHRTRTFKLLSPCAIPSFFFCSCSWYVHWFSCFEVRLRGWEPRVGLSLVALQRERRKKHRDATLSHTLPPSGCLPGRPCLECRHPLSHGECGCFSRVYFGLRLVTRVLVGISCACVFVICGHASQRPCASTCISYCRWLHEWVIDPFARLFFFSPTLNGSLPRVARAHNLSQMPAPDPTAGPAMLSFYMSFDLSEAYCVDRPAWDQIDTQITNILQISALVRCVVGRCLWCAYLLRLACC
jgi:hypothetical protein